MVCKQTKTWCGWCLRCHTFGIFGFLRLVSEYDANSRDSSNSAYSPFEAPPRPGTHPKTSTLTNAYQANGFQNYCGTMPKKLENQVSWHFLEIIAHLSLTGVCSDIDIIQKCLKWTQVGVHRLNIPKGDPQISCTCFDSEKYSNHANNPDITWDWQKCSVAWKISSRIYKCHCKFADKQSLSHKI